MPVVDFSLLVVAQEFGSAMLIYLRNEFLHRQDYWYPETWVADSVAMKVETVSFQQFQDDDLFLPPVIRKIEKSRGQPDYIADRIVFWISAFQ